MHALQSCAAHAAQNLHQGIQGAGIPHSMQSISAHFCVAHNWQYGKYLCSSGEARGSVVPLGERERVSCKRQRVSSCSSTSDNKVSLEVRDMIEIFALHARTLRTACRTRDKEGLHNRTRS